MLWEPLLLPEQPFACIWGKAVQQGQVGGQGGRQGGRVAGNAG